MLIDIHSVLVIWGQMASERGCKGYPTMESFVKETPHTGSGRRLDEATFLEIDRLFIQLFKQNETQFLVLRDRYIKRLERREIQRQLHLGKSQFDFALAQGKAFICGGLAAKTNGEIWY